MVWGSPQPNMGSCLEGTEHWKGWDPLAWRMSLPLKGLFMLGYTCLASLSLLTLLSLSYFDRPRHRRNCYILQWCMINSPISVGAVFMCLKFYFDTKRSFSWVIAIFWGSNLTDLKLQSPFPKVRHEAKAPFSQGFAESSCLLQRGPVSALAKELWPFH